MFSWSSLSCCLRTCSKLSARRVSCGLKAVMCDGWRYPHQGHATLLPRPLHTSTCHRDLMEFFDDKKNWGEGEVRVGRAWKADELRLKSNQDLHKLWYVLLKEKNMLLTAEHFYEKVENELFPNPERIDKVEESMRNLELVVKERNAAYWQLEVSEAEDGCQPVRRERNQFGIMAHRPLVEHAEPETDENRFRPAKAYKSRDVGRFLALRREKERVEARKEKRRQERHVVGLLKRFPDLDDDLLKAKYPDVDLEKAKRHKLTLGNFANRI